MIPEAVLWLPHAGTYTQVSTGEHTHTHCSLLSCIPSGAVITWNSLRDRSWAVFINLPTGTLTSPVPQ